MSFIQKTTLMHAMRLSEMAHLLGGELTGNDVLITEVSTDSRSLNPGALFVALPGPRFDGHEFVAAAQRRGAAGALVSRTLASALPQIRVTDTRLALGGLGAAWRECFRGPLIALTGSNGKTTVKEMLAAILRCRGDVLATSGNLNNDIGVPLTLLRLNKEQYAVIEMGANHLGEIRYLSALAQPDVALITNAGPAHLDGFGDLNGVARGKGEIFQGLRSTGIAVINRDDPFAAYWVSLTRNRNLVDFALEHSAQVEGRVLDLAHNHMRLSVGGHSVEIKLPLPGLHNLRNALAAAAASIAVGVTLDEIQQGLQSSYAVSGRLQHLQGVNGITVINDTYNANPASLNAALRTIGAAPGNKWLVLGDMAELGAEAEALHEAAGAFAQAVGFQRCYTVGSYSRQTAVAFGAGGMHFNDVKALIQELQEAVAQSGDKVTILVKGSRSMRMERVVHTLIPEPQRTEE
jgi:UDP-N-acetylmuramoyl-tripeptide--D-alanyl-D-alanine ligase